VTGWFDALLIVNGTKEAECHVEAEEECCELYHGTLDVCTVNKIGKYNCRCKMVDSLYAAIETQK
jgi:hypothetical protein